MGIESYKKFNFLGSKYSVHFDDGCVSSVIAPGGCDVWPVPPEMEADPRFQRLVASERSFVGSCWDAHDEDVARDEARAQERAGGSHEPLGASFEDLVERNDRHIIWRLRRSLAE